MATKNLNIADITEAQDDKEVTANDAHDGLDRALTDLVTLAGDNNHTLTTPPSEVAPTAMGMKYRKTGTLTAQRDVIVPTNAKLYVFENASTGFSVRWKTSAQSTNIPVILPGAFALLYCDGTNVEEIVLSAVVPDTVVQPGGVTQGPVVFSLTTELSSPAGSVVVSNIPQNADYLEIFFQARHDQAGAKRLQIRLNADAGANYDGVLHSANASGTSGYTGAGDDGENITFIPAGSIDGSGAPANRFNIGRATLMGYTDTGKHKAVVGDEHNAGAAVTDLNRGNYGGTWNNTAAVTSITLLIAADSLVAGTSLTVVGYKRDALGSFNAGVGGVSHAFITMAAAQTSNLAVNDHVEFDTIADNSPDITLATGAGQLDGLITLPPGKLFSMRCRLRPGFASGTGNQMAWQFRNNTDAALIGQKGEEITPISGSFTARTGESVVFIDTTAGAKEVEVRIIQETGLSATGNIGPESYFLIEEIPQNRESPHLAAKASLTGNDTLATSGVAAEITWDQIEEELGDWGSLGTNTDWVVPSGVERVVVVAQVKWTGNATGTRQIQVFKNGAAVSPLVRDTDANLNAAEDFIQRLVSEPIDVVATDTISIEALQDSGGSLAIIGTTDESYFAVYAVKGVGESRIEMLNFFVDGAVAAKTYVICQSAPFAFRIDEIITQLGGGTNITFDLEIDGVDVTGIAAQVATTTEAVDVATALNAVPVGGRVTLVTTSPTGSPLDLGLTVKATRT